MFELNGTNPVDNREVAVRNARSLRRRERVAVTVTDTDTSETIFYAPAPRAIRQITKYTRVVALPYGLQAPDGMRAAYVFIRSNGAVLFDNQKHVYRVMNLRTGKLLSSSYATAAAAGARVSQGVGGRRAV